MGAGVAGLQAIATAKRLGAVVGATDVRAAAGDKLKVLAPVLLWLRLMKVVRRSRRWRY